MVERAPPPEATEPGLDVPALLARLEEAESTLSAIRNGHVEALVVSSADGPKVYALEGSEHRYRRLVETMNEGALLVSASGIILYSNAAFAEMVAAPLERVIGKTLGEFVVHRQEHLLSALLEGASARGGAGELMLCDVLGNERPVYLSVAASSPGEEPGLSVIVTDLTEQKKNQQIVASERLANAILEQSAEPIIVCDVNGVIMRASGAARTIAGGRVLRRHFFHAFPFQAGNEDEEHPVLAALRGHTTAGREMTLAVSGRPVQSFLCTAAPLLDDSMKILGCVVALVDISDRKRVEAARSSLLDAERAARASAEHARFEAEASSRAKDEFLATVSHELRTPLNAMLGWSQLLTNNSLPADKLDHALEVIQRNVLAQSRLVEDLLDVSRIVSGQMRLEVQPVEPIRVVSAAIESAKPAIEAKHIQLEVDLDASAGQILGDATRVQQIVWNLLSNATKFTEQGGKIAVRVARVDSSVEIVVSDTGQGIETEFLPFVFDRFRQADGSFARRHGGLGLGLAIARHLVELHGGTIKVESAGPNCGSRFVVRLPYAASRNSPAPLAGNALQMDFEPPSRLTAPELRGIRVLVVDDDDDSRDLVVSILEKCEAITYAASSAEQALSIIVRDHPDVLVSDIGMPGMDGYELVRAVRALPDERAQRVPAVAVTAYARQEDQRRALAEGFQLHVAKPIEPASFAQAVARLSRGTQLALQP
ncbi:MAG TPA: ATP-binding protein [Polyangiaceae bacterium]|nr:ATP-binding protein [Polyangiaceae bacterium]